MARGGTDTLVYNGTAANDSFTIGRAAGQVNLNSRLVLNTTGVETLTLEGFAGDDTFTLVPAISASVYSTINLNGGGQASAAGDRVVLIGTAGADDIVISGQLISLGGKTINSKRDRRHSPGCSGRRLTSSPTTGSSGVTENITVSSSGVAGGGQISVPGVALVNFSRRRADRRQWQRTHADRDGHADLCRHQRCRHVQDQPGGGRHQCRSDPEADQNGTHAAHVGKLHQLQHAARARARRRRHLQCEHRGTARAGRNLFVDGGLPTGKKKSTDNLNIFYTPPRPSIIHSAATQDPDAGIVDLDYGTARFVVQYDDIEQVAPRGSEPARDRASANLPAQFEVDEVAWCRCRSVDSAYGSRMLRSQLTMTSIRQLEHIAAGTSSSIGSAARSGKGEHWPLN